MGSSADHLRAPSRASEPIEVRLGGLVTATRTVGPGLRDAIYFQGCTLGCVGCANRSFLPIAGGHVVRIASVLDHLSRRVGRIDGASILGGEPTQQPAALRAIVTGIKRLGLSTVVFTGRLYEELAADHVFDEILAHTDLLIDGPFIEEQRAPDLYWRGSSNQKLVRLGSRFSESDLVPSGPTREIVIGPDRLHFIGV